MYTLFTKYPRGRVITSTVESHYNECLGEAEEIPYEINSL